jgi:hypothetical protein
MELDEPSLCQLEWADYENCSWASVLKEVYEVFLHLYPLSTRANDESSPTLNITRVSCTL